MHITLLIFLSIITIVIFLSGMWIFFMGLIYELYID
ncbi:hypothetical protein CLOBOL_06487 [Enterocloster bolteae ATCC BAA-613]|uniref:Uncharacterized protein n=1 Tax=Enterocloster bolteae (strain ATCC BAA-613 / DSM 15670 / CCUG 46953 / JCM 12243 / WAL 16351) TaxID=411902 RepID=A8S344_ENTBW|nr:hypothetical protein CLOBOL_06487 [Enterocloster bolteae ATCC BAA-613]